MEITQEFEVLQLRTHTSPEGYENAIKVVQWEIKFKSQGYSSKGRGLTDLSTYPINNFIPADQLTADDIFNMVKQTSFSGGAWDEYVAVHEENLQNKLDRASLNVYMEKEGFTDYDLMSDAELEALGTSP